MAWGSSAFPAFRHFSIVKHSGIFCASFPYRAWGYIRHRSWKRNSPRYGFRIHGGIFPRYGALSLCVGLIPGKGMAALVRLFRALVVDMGVCLAVQRGIYPDSGNIMHCISYPATIRHIRATSPIEAHSLSHWWNYTVKGTRAL